MSKRNLDMRKIYDIMIDLQNESPLPTKNREHMLQGEYSGYLECHIATDWLLIYKIDDDLKEIYFARTGSHSDLF